MKNLLVVFFALSISTQATAEDQFTISTGFDYSSGKYGNTTSTDILYIPVSGKYESDDWTLKLTVPYISITGSGGVVQGMGRIGPAKRTGTMMGGTSTTTDSGMGDVTASAGYNVYDVDALSFDMVGNLKLGTADSNKGLGTGKNDYSAQLDSYYILEKTTLFATVGYKIYGAPAGITLNNVRYGSIGVSQKVADITSAGLMLDTAESPSATGSNRLELTAFISHKLSEGFKIQTNVMKGLSNGSPDFGGGATISAIF